MASRLGYPLALAVCVTAGVAALWAAFWAAPDQTGLTTAELLRVEELDPPTTPLAEQAQWTFELLAGDRMFTSDDLDRRFSDTFGDDFTIELMQEQTVGFLDVFGPTRFVRYLVNDGDRVVIALAAAENGAPLKVSMQVDASGEFMLWSIDDFETGSRLPGWAMAVAAFGGWASIAASVALWRWSAMRPSWVLLGGSLAAFSTHLVLSDEPAAYVIGRVGPAAGLALATWLLVGRLTEGRARWALALAGGGSVAAALAVVTRDPVLIGHPSIGLLTDDDRALRLALVIAALAATAAMTIATSVHIGIGRAGGHWRRPQHVVAAGATSTWALASGFAVLDLTIGSGRLAAGALQGVVLTVVAAVPAVVVFRHVSSRWDRPELAGLVIDVGAGGTDLGHAVRRALDDESARVLVSPDGIALADDQATTVDPDALATGRALALVRSGEDLLGAIEHDAELPMAAERVGAIAATIGLALRVERLNAQVNAQLEEVEASRARIIEASDDARRQLARDLHDGAQQRLVGLGMELQRGRRLAEAGRTDELAALLEHSTVETRAAITELRAVSRGAPPAILADRGLRAAVDALAERSPVPVDIHESGSPLPEQLELTAYYVIAEGLTNAAKHAGARLVNVSIARRNGEAVVRVVDDGAGGAKLSPNSGLEGLQDRVEAAGGSFSIESPAGGTTIEATLPCE